MLPNPQRTVNGEALTAARAGATHGRPSVKPESGNDIRAPYANVCGLLSIARPTGAGVLPKASCMDVRPARRVGGGQHHTMLSAQGQKLAGAKRDAI